MFWHFTITFQLIKVKYFPKTVGNGEFTYGVFVFIPLHIITYISSYIMHQQFVFINKKKLKNTTLEIHILASIRTGIKMWMAMMVF
jgi:hypothetical protein